MRLNTYVHNPSPLLDKTAGAKMIDSIIQGIWRALKATHFRNNNSWSSDSHGNYWNENLEYVLDWDIWYLVSVSGQGQIKYLEWIKKKTKLCDTWANGFWKYNAVSSLLSVHVGCAFLWVICSDNYSKIASLCFWPSSDAVSCCHQLLSLGKLKFILPKSKPKSTKMFNYMIYWKFKLKFFEIIHEFSAFLG